MRRLLARISIIAAISAFALLSLIFVLHVNIIIPIILFAVALVLLYVVKRMPNDETGISGSKPNDAAFFDSGSPSAGTAVSGRDEAAERGRTAADAGKNSDSTGKKGSNGKKNGRKA